MSALGKPPEPRRWFGPEDADALRDLYGIYEAYVNVADVVRLAAEEEPALAAAARAMAQRWTPELARTKREVVRRAFLEDEWTTYQSDLCIEAQYYADYGIVDWTILGRLIARKLTPRVVDAFEAEPRRLARVLLVMHEFLNRVTTTLGAAYLERRDAIARDIDRRSKRLIASSMVGVWVFDDHGKTTLMNARLAKILGVTIEEGLTLPITELIHPDDRDTMPMRRAQRERGEGASYEQRLLRRDGTVCWALLESSPLFDDDGRFEGVLTMVTDITQRKLAEEALRRSESRFRTLADSGLIGVIVFDQDGEPIEVNDVVTTIVGYTRGELLGGTVHWAELTPPEWAAKDQIAIEQLKESSVSTPREKEYFRKDGSRVPVLVGVARVDNNNEFIAFIVDLTERKRAEAQIEHLRLERVADAKFRALLESAPDAMVIVDESGRIVLTNAQTESLFGYTRDEILDKPIEILIPERARAIHPSHRAGYFKSPHPRAMGMGLDLFARRKNGDEIPIDVSLNQLETESGFLVSAAIRDITPRRKIELALRLANHELEAFSYSVAHDLRAPLRGMNGFAKILLEEYADKLDAEGVKYLHHICSNALRMGDLIDALLSLAQVSRTKLDAKRIDLSAIARSTLAELRATDPTRNVEVIVADNLECEIDPALARTLLDNLMRNAWKFTSHRDDATIEVGQTARGEFFVRDNGAGFDMAHAKKLFAPFQRLHTAKEYPGTGIGLATCRRIVDRHGGSIWAESAPSKGATFLFSVPRIRNVERNQGVEEE